MSRLRLIVVLALAALIAAVVPASARQGTAVSATLRVFLDCYECDTEYLKQHIVFIDYMRDRTDADLHVLVTTQSTGGGGQSWTLKFIGLGRFQSQDRTHTFTTPQTATFDDQRKEFARVFSLGLAAYAADTAAGPDLDVTFSPPQARGSIEKGVDRWRGWAFRTSGSGSASGEQLSKFHSYSLSFSGSRVTEEFKASFGISGRQSRSRFTLSDGRQVLSVSDSWNTNSSMAKSLGPKLSAGLRFSAGHSSFSNEDRVGSVYPGVEYNFFRYAEYERRRFTIWYEIGPNFYRYKEMTIFDKLTDYVTKQQVDVSLTFRQPWGSLGVFSSFSQHLDHPERYRASLFGSTDVRLFKGFSFNVYTRYAKIHDQIGLPKQGASTEEVLLRLRQLATSYEYYMSVGFSYSFGSIFNNIVNPRFGGGSFFFF